MKDRSGLPTATPISTSEAVRLLLNPGSVAVIGASTDERKAGGRVLTQILRHGPGPHRVFAVHPTADTVQNVRAYPTLGDIPDAIDVAVIAVPAAAVPGAVRDCAAVGVKVALIITSGFAETGPEGAALQTELYAAAEKAGVRIAGPNCVGVINFNEDRALFFGTVLMDWTRPFEVGRVALVSQSGALATHLLMAADECGLEFSHVVTTGNELDLTWADHVREVARRPDVDMVLGYVENIRDGGQFRDALAEVRRGGTDMVILKAGRTTAGVRSAMAHTAALISDDQSVSAVLRKHAVTRVDDLSQLLAHGILTGGGRRRFGGRIAIVTGSGGLGVVLTDLADDLGLSVPELSDEVQAKLRTGLPAFASPANPIDASGELGRSGRMLNHICTVLMDCAEVDGVVCLLGANRGHADQLADEVARLAGHATDKFLVTVWPEVQRAIAASLNRRGVPSFTDPTRALHAIAGAVRASAAPLAEEPSTPPIRDDTFAPDSVIDLTERLRDRGVPMPEHVLCSDPGEFRRAALAQRAPFMMKLLRPGEAHKTEWGGVVGPIAPGDNDAVDRFLTIGLRPGDQLEIQEYVTADWELFVGLRRDAHFGTVLAVGWGGTLVNSIADATTFLPPVTPDELRETLTRTSLRAAIDGDRGRAAVDPVALAGLIALLVEVFELAGLDLLECNPIIVRRGTAALTVVDVHAEFEKGPDHVGSR